MPFPLLVALLGATWMIVAEALWEWLAARTLLGFGAGCVRPGVRRYLLVVDPGQAGKRLGTLAASTASGEVPREPASTA